VASSLGTADQHLGGPRRRRLCPVGGKRQRDGPDRRHRRAPIRQSSPQPSGRWPSEPIGRKSANSQPGRTKRESASGTDHRLPPLRGGHTHSIQCRTASQNDACRPPGRRAERHLRRARGQQPLRLSGSWRRSTSPSWRRTRSSTSFDCSERRTKEQIEHATDNEVNEGPEWPLARHRRIGMRVAAVVDILHRVPSDRAFGHYGVS